jgi:uncharacterized heparinase superfamily protein
LTDLSLSDRLKLARIAALRGARTLRRGAAMPLRLTSYVSTRRPARLLIAPQDIRTADPTIANDIYGGYFALGGKAVQLRGQSPFEIDPPSAPWSRNLMGFGWLRHLRAADTALTKANAKALITDWLNFAERGFPAAAGRNIHEPRVAARRIISWLSHSPMILDEASLSFYKRFLSRLSRQAAQLQAAVTEGLQGDARVLAAIALAQCSLCVEGLEGLQRKHGRLLSAELARQILPDGGHVSRNPQLLAELLVDLLPLRQAYAARGVAAPAELDAAMARMMPMLRMMRHGNGELALFNGMGPTAPDLLATVLAYDDGRGLPPMAAAQSGYQRRQAGDCVLVADTGRAPPSVYSEEAHAGCLSFEFSAGLERLVINCGAGAPEGSDLRQAARATAAHSTLTLADASSIRFAAQTPSAPGWRRRVIAGPKHVTLEATPEGGDLAILATHDGYVSRFGFLHRRQLALDPSGGALFGDDQLVPARRNAAPASEVYALRFHLHPDVTASLTEDHQGAWLDLPSGESWYFSAQGAPIALEESIYLGSPHGPKRCEQLVLRASTAERLDVSWAFQRHAPEEEAPQPEEAAEPETDAASS